MSSRTNANGICITKQCRNLNVFIRKIILSHSKNKHKNINQEFQIINHLIMWGTFHLVNSGMRLQQHQKRESLKFVTMPTQSKLNLIQI